VNPCSVVATAVLPLLPFRALDCGRLTRRAALGVGSLGVIGLSLADLLRLESAAAAEKSPRAKSVILLWLWGGPSHLDTFDLKPKAPIQYRGPYAPIATTVPGIQICELLPHLARRADQYAIIRSLHCASNDHGIAGTIGLTGSEAGGASLGSPTGVSACRPPRRRTANPSRRSFPCRQARPPRRLWSLL